MGPLNITIDTTSAQTQVPFFVENSYVKFACAKVNLDQVKDKGDVIKFEFDLRDPAPTPEGQTILPGAFGSKVFVSVQLYDKNTKPGDGVPKWAVEKLAKITDALLGTGDPNNTKNKPSRPPFNAETVSMLIGKECFLKFKNKTGEYTGQDVTTFTYMGDVAGA